MSESRITQITRVTRILSDFSPDLRIQGKLENLAIKILPYKNLTSLSTLLKLLIQIGFVRRVMAMIPVLSDVREEHKNKDNEKLELYF